MGKCSLGRALKCLFDLMREVKADKITKEVAAANKQTHALASALSSSIFLASAFAVIAATSAILKFQQFCSTVRLAAPSYKTRVFAQRPCGRPKISLCPSASPSALCNTKC